MGFDRAWSRREAPERPQACPTPRLTRGRAGEEARLALTPAGEAALAGQLDRVKQCGIEAWVGGVHLSGREVAWRWDGTAGAVVRRS